MSSIWDDILDESRKPTDAFNPNWRQDCLDHRQALISKTKKGHITAFSVERQYINSKAWHDKFEKLPINDIVRESLYRHTGRLLEFVNNLEGEKQSQERLLAINARTGTFIVDNFNREGEIYRTGFDDDEYRKIEACQDSIIIVHNHSLNGRPSGQDLLAYLHSEKVRISVIACHDGNIYAIYAVSPEFEEKYKDQYEEYKTRTGDSNQAKKITMTNLYRYNDQLPEKRKLFDIRLL